MKISRRHLLGAGAFSLLLPMSSASIWSQTFRGTTMPYDAFDKLEQTSLEIGGATLKIAFAPGTLQMPHDRILEWLKTSAQAVTIYYGRFPASAARILIVPAEGEGIMGGQAFGYRGPAIRLLVGTATTSDDLIADWKAVHEMVHLALPDVSEDHLWLAEGLAVYVEPIARVQSGDLRPEKIWTDMVRDMPKGLPREGDEGLDHTHTWGRTYWGGAMFCLLADIGYRQQSHSRVGLQQAMRGVLAAGGTHDQDWPIARVFSVADRAAGYPVMTNLYAEMRDKPYAPDLPKLWNDLGIMPSGNTVTFRDSAPLAQIRSAITARLRTPL
jgi:hypothetical protein